MHLLDRSHGPPSFGLPRLLCSSGTSSLTGFDKIIGDAGDARLDIFLRENFLQFLRGQAEFLSPPMFFPVKGTLGYSDAYLLDALIYVPLRVLGIDPFLTFELLCIGLSLVGFVSTEHSADTLCRSPTAARGARGDHLRVFKCALYFDGSSAVV